MKLFNDRLADLVHANLDRAHKVAFVPADASGVMPPGGAPPGGDPSMGGMPPGMPPGGAPMPPGGDPSMGGMPPGGDPSMGGGMPPAPAPAPAGPDPLAALNSKLDQLIGKIDGFLAAGGGGSKRGGGGGAAAAGGGDKVLQLLQSIATQLGVADPSQAGGQPPAPGVSPSQMTQPFGAQGTTMPAGMPGSGMTVSAAAKYAKAITKKE